MLLWWCWLALAASPEIVVDRGHGAEVVCFSESGELWLTCGEDGEVVAWDAESRQEKHRFQAFAGNFERFEAVFSGNGRTVVVSSEDGVRVHDVATGDVVRTVVDAPRTIAVAGRRRDVLLHAPRLRGWSNPPPTDDNRTVLAVDIETGRPGAALVADGAVHSIWVSADRSRVVVADVDGGAVVFRANGKRVASARSPAVNLDSVGVEGLVDPYNQPRAIVAAGAIGDAPVVVGWDGVVRVYDPVSGAVTGEVAALSSPGQFSMRGAVAADGLHAVVGGDSELGVVDLRDLSVVRYPLTEGPSQVAATAHQVVSWGFNSRAATVIDIDGGARAQAFAPRLSRVRQLSTHGGDRAVSVVLDGMPLVTWDLSTGQPRFSEQRGVGTAPDRPVGASQGDDGQVRVFDALTGSTLGRVAVPGVLRRGTVVPGGSRLVFKSGSGFLQVADPASGEVRSLDLAPLGPFDLARSGSEVVFALGEGAGRYDLATGAVRQLWPRARGAVAAFVPGGAEVITSYGPYLVKWPSDADEPVARTEEIRGDHAALAVDTTGRWSAFSTWRGQVEVWDWESGSGTSILAHAGPVEAIDFTAGGALVSGGYDGVVRVWDPATGDERCALYTFRDRTWAVVDADGRYDASHGGDLPNLHFRVDDELVALDQLKARFYQPGLARVCFGVSDEALRSVADLGSIALFPDVDLAADGREVAISLEDRGGGIGRVAVFLNGKEVTADARELGARSAGRGRVRVAVDLAGSPFLDPAGGNRVEVVAFDEQGFLASRATAIVLDSKVADAPPPRLFALVAGVSDYAGEALDLRYAAKDAVDFGRGLELGAQALFDAGVDVKVLSTEEGHDRPTRDRVLAELDRIAAAARPGDVVVVYLSGHGVTWGGPDGDFFYLTADAATGELDDPAVRGAVALSSDVIRDRLNGIPALKQVLVLDTCHAGRIVEGLGATRAVPGSQVRALERMKDRSGLFVLAGSAADAVSYEASRYGQGLLTWSLLSGMSGAATREGSLWDVAGLFGYAADTVPELARGLGGIQRPVVAVPRGGGSFDVGRVTDAVRAGIHLARDRPVVERSNFQDEVAFDDALGLMSEVDDVLRGRASGVDAPIVFVDARGYADAVRVVGRYGTTDGKTHLKLRFLRGDDVLGAAEVVGGADVAELARDVAEALLVVLATPE